MVPFTRNVFQSQSQRLTLVSIKTRIDIMSKLQALIVCKSVFVYIQIICMLAPICCISVSRHLPASE